MHSTSEHFQLRSGPPHCAPGRNAPAVRFAALALVLGTLGSVVPEIISPIAAGAATTPVTWNTALTCGTYDYAVVPPGTTSITATIYGAGGGGAAGSWDRQLICGIGGRWRDNDRDLCGVCRHQHRNRHRLWWCERDHNQ